ncbi:MAG: DUF177 domain-containing protein [Patescibacteria group bacterium]|nr:DUF177 domain-containing protein [Patescibacteria group bacterium]
MELNVKNLAYSELGNKESYDLKLEAKDFETDDYIDEVTGTVDLSRVDDGILAEFKLDLSVNLNCDRCLTRFTFKPKLKFSRIYSLTPIMTDDNDYLPVEKDFQINVTEPIREETVLAIPVKKVCKADCKGLCPTCGTDLNTGKCKCGKKKD